MASCSSSLVSSLVSSSLASPPISFFGDCSEENAVLLSPPSMVCLEDEVGVRGSTPVSDAADDAVEEEEEVGGVPFIAVEGSEVVWSVSRPSTSM